MDAELLKRAKKQRVSLTKQKEVSVSVTGSVKEVIGQLQYMLDELKLNDAELVNDSYYNHDVKLVCQVDKTEAELKRDVEKAEKASESTRAKKLRQLEKLKKELKVN